jgi:choline dehydrogenase-like flavoprotein
VLGKYVAFHNYRASIYGKYDGFLDKTTDGRSHTSAYLPRFRNVEKQETDFLRGYATGFFAGRSIARNTDGFGQDLKDNLDSKILGPWDVGAGMMGETIPKETNTVSLDQSRKDKYGIPLLKIDIEYDDNDEKMIKDFHQEMSEMMIKAGFYNIKTNDSKQAPGLDIHEMGGIRMGHDPKHSMLNKWNQLHACSNVFVTDGSCMTSTSTQNPSLTYMALTARAADHAMLEMKKGNL